MDLVICRILMQALEDTDFRCEACKGVRYMWLWKSAVSEYRSIHYATTRI